MKTTCELYDQNRRMFAAFIRRSTRLARAADPATGGNAMLVGNWGNDEARKVWADGWAMWRRIDSAYEAAYHAAPHPYFDTFSTPARHFGRAS